MSGRAVREQWKLLIVCPHPLMSRQVRAAIDQLGFEDASILDDYPRMGVVNSIAAKNQANLCLLDVASQQEQALPLISEVAPVMPVVALNPSNDADLILRCLRRGACEFLSEISPEQVRSLLDRLSRLRAPTQIRKPATVYCLVPGNAGCGASTLAVHLAVELKRAGAGKTLLVDGDYLAASVGFLLKLKTDFHLDDAVRDCLRLDEDLWKHLVLPVRGIDVLTAPEDPTAVAQLDRPSAVELICFWRDHYDAVVLDTAGPSGAGGCLASLSDEILLVTTNELGAQHATKRSVDCLARSGVPGDRVKLVVTRYTPHTGLKSGDLETALQVAPFALLSNDYDAVQKAVLEGSPVSSGSHFARSVHDLVQRLLGKSNTPQKRSPLFGLLSLRP